MSHQAHSMSFASKKPTPFPQHPFGGAVQEHLSGIPGWWWFRVKPLTAAKTSIPHSWFILQRKGSEKNWGKRSSKQMELSYKIASIMATAANWGTTRLIGFQMEYWFSDNRFDISEFRLKSYKLSGEHLMRENAERKEVLRLSGKACWVGF